MTPFPENRKDPYRRLALRAYDLCAERDKLTVAEIALLMNVSPAHVYSVTRPTAGLRGKPANKIADDLYRLFSAELGAEIDRAAWDQLWAELQAQAAEGTTAFRNAVEVIRASHPSLAKRGNRRRAVEGLFQAAHASAANGPMAETA